MPQPATTLLLVGVPSAAWAVGSIFIVVRHKDLNSMPPNPSSPVVPGRIVTFFAIAFTPTLFGLVLWFLVAGLEVDFGPRRGLPASLIFWGSASFAVTSVVTVGVETWISWSRLRQYASAAFARVWSIIVIPETAVVFSLVLVFLTLGIVRGYLEGTDTVTGTRADRIILGLQVYALTTLALPVAAFFSNRVREIATVRQWVRALSLIEVGAAIPLVGLAWAFLQLGP